MAPTDEARSIRADLLRHLHETRPALLAGERQWSWQAYVDEAAKRANTLATHWAEGRPRHVGVLADNTPEMAFQLAAAGLGTHVLVGLNTTRRGAALLADIRKSDCAVVVVEPAHRPLLDGLDLDGITVIDTSTAAWSADSSVPDADPGPDDLFMLVFTSGTGGDPKAVRVTHHKVTFPGRYLTEKLGLTADDVLSSAMPLFHSNGVMANWAISVANGCTVALPSGGRFSASGILDDVRRHGATYANYVGKPLVHVLATPARPDDADNPLRMAFGNEAGEQTVRRFSERFACRVVDGFGSSENAVVVSRTADTPPGALGAPPSTRRPAYTPGSGE
jgi:fatty-acyl-CoA synthase